MFADTHFHLHHLSELGIDIPNLFSQLSQNDFRFLLDIGTKCDDLLPRLQVAENAFASCENSVKDKIRQSLFYTAGIWPDDKAISDRNNQVKELKNQILAFPLRDRIVAVGECGLDHHWNPSGVDGRCLEDFPESILHGEEEMFEMQIELARELALPIVIHSRDAFEGTLNCIKNVGYHNGEIHCFSYGINEAKAFLDLGWYIALGGAVTYTKKSKLDDMIALIRYIPRDRLLLETDAPYLAPVPHRGKTNTPALIVHTYQFISQILGISTEELALVSVENAKNLFCS